MPNKTKSSGGKPSPTKTADNVSVETAASGGALDPRSDQVPAKTASDAEVADFVARMRSLSPTTKAGRGRLIFAMDATMSRQPTWDLALALQADMFRAVKEVGGLDVQLVYFRGSGECRSSKWVSDPEALARLMTSVGCMGGHTQIGRVLGHIRREAEAGHVSAVVYVGDAMEENVDDLAQCAGEIALFGVPVFLFQEGQDGGARIAFKEIARLTKGAYCHFDTGSARQLRELLSAVAVYAAGGRGALERLAHEKNGSGARLLISQMR